MAGCKNARVYRDVDDKSIFLLVEKWQHQRKLDDHMKTSLFGAKLGMRGLLVKEPEIMFMTEDK